MRDDFPPGSTECPKCGAPVWAPCETPEHAIGEERVGVTFDFDGRTYAENYPPACLAPAKQ